jgi:hypothetical protein
MGRKKIAEKKEIAKKTVKADKVVELENNETPSVEAFSDKPSSVELENMELKKQLEELNKKFEALMEFNKTEKDIIPEHNNEEECQVEVPLNKLIKVISLYTGGMTLKPHKDSHKKYRFENFGDRVSIVYSDLEQIIANHSRFCKDGYFMILDNDVVRVHDLEGCYKKILNKKQIENILNNDNETIKDMFINTTPNIQQSIIQLVCDRINSDDKVDSNKVNLLSELCGFDVRAYANGEVESLVNKYNN